MIVVRLMGGLGNQMFQYAFGRLLALKNNTELKLDVFNLSNAGSKREFTVRNFDLACFNIDADAASEIECANFKKNKFLKIKDLLSLYVPINKSSAFYLREPFFSFFGKALVAPANTYLDGYWQTEKYFSSIRPQLLADFTSLKPLSEKSQEIETKIKKSNSISIHVRRGDYVSIPHNTAIYEVCSARYYNDAIKLILDKFPDASFFVFSDEPEWFKNNIGTGGPFEFVTHNKGAESYQDLILMSLCKHNIIANSSFSWWAAWLNKNTEKLVIAPREWFKDRSKNTKDLIPPTWRQL